MLGVLQKQQEARGAKTERGTGDVKGVIKDRGRPCWVFQAIASTSASTLNEMQSPGIFKAKD